MAPEDSATDNSDDYRGDYNQAMEHALLGQIGFFPDQLISLVSSNNK